MSAITQQANEVMGAVNQANQTISDITHTSVIFPRVDLTSEAGIIVAVILMVGGLASCTLGQRFVRIFIAVVAFGIGTALFMYPIDAVVGKRLCPGLEDSLCPWSFVIGMGFGLVIASVALRLERVSVAVLGAIMGLLIALLLQPLFQYMFRGLPEWSWYVHYLVLGAAGAALGMKFRDIMGIATSALFGSACLMIGISYLAKSDFSPAKFVEARHGRVCDSGACWGQLVGAIIMAILSIVFQAFLYRRRQRQLNGEEEREKIEEVIERQRSLNDLVYSNASTLTATTAARLFSLNSSAATSPSSHHSLSPSTMPSSPFMGRTLTSANSSTCLISPSATLTAKDLENNLHDDDSSSSSHGDNDHHHNRKQRAVEMSKRPPTLDVV